MIKIKHDRQLVDSYCNKIINKKFSISQLSSRLKKIVGKVNKKEITFFDLFKYLKKNSVIFGKVYNDIELDSIIKCHDLIQFIDSIEDKKNSLTTQDYKYLKEIEKEIFDYKKKFQSRIITPFFREKINLKICYYCNRNYIMNISYNDYSNEVTTFELDHFYENNFYPYLSLSYYNLIPCCHTCNSSLKNKFIKKEENSFFKNSILPPSHDNFDFEEKVLFKSYYSKPVILNENLEFRLKDEEFDYYIKVFKLNEVYRLHYDEIHKLIKLRKNYSKSKIEQLSRLLKKNEEEIIRDIFGDWLFLNNLENKSLSKFLKDISMELHLL